MTPWHRKWLSFVWKALLASMVLSLLLNPALQVFAPMLDIVGFLGFDGILLLVDIQVAIWIVPLLKTWVVPFLTKLWNRYGAPPLGMPPSENVMADVSRSFFHALLCYGGQGGLAMYFMYVAASHHVALVSAVPVT